MLDYNLPGCDIELVEHVIRNVPGKEWDGPGMIRMECWGLTPEEAIATASKLKPKSEYAVAVRAYDQVHKIWLDTGEPAWNPRVHGL